MEDKKCNECDNENENILNYNNILYYLCNDCYVDYMNENEENE